MVLGQRGGCEPKVEYIFEGSNGFLSGGLKPVAGDEKVGTIPKIIEDSGRRRVNEVPGA